MIPKVIHYCWFGHNPLPKLAQKCINSWKKYLSDYEIKEWNEDTHMRKRHTRIKNMHLLQMWCDYMHSIMKVESIWIPMLK